MNVPVSNNTSDAQSDIKKEMVCLATIPNETREYLCKTMYHVVFDCDFGKFYNQAARTNYQTGKRIPIVYDRDDAIRIAQKLIDIAVNRGSYGFGYEKKYPFLGAVVIGFQFTDYREITHSRGEPNSNSNHSLVFYDVEKEGKKLQRGNLSNSSLNDILITDATYVTRDDISSDNGFALLNLVPDLSVKDINLLKCLYNGDETCANSINTYIHTSSKKSIQLGGNDDYYKSYVKEKALYLSRKGQPNTSSTVHVGGNNDEIDFYRLYKQKKAEYKRLKQTLAQKQ